MNKLTPKMIIMDLDDTLLMNDKCISNYNLSILTKCRKNGIIIGIATSRSEYSSKRYIEQIKPDISIVNAGALTLDYNNNIIDKKLISKEIAYVIVKELYGQKKVGEIHLETENNHYIICNENIPENILYENKYHYWNIAKKLDNDLLKIRLELFDENIYIRLKEKYIECEINGFFGEEWYMIKNKEATKIKTLKEMAQKMNISMEDICAFGDDYSDIGMITECGIGVAMENGIKEIKKKAKYICGKNNEDGVGKWIEEKVL
jgi:Cof subfamily protein (haloacid dehalogenase superfamily)